MDEGAARMAFKNAGRRPLKKRLLLFLKTGCASLVCRHAVAVLSLVKVCVRPGPKLRKFVAAGLLVPGVVLLHLLLQLARLQLKVRILLLERRNARLKSEKAVLEIKNNLSQLRGLLADGRVAAGRDEGPGKIGGGLDGREG